MKNNQKIKSGLRGAVNKVQHANEFIQRHPVFPKYSGWIFTLVFVIIALFNHYPSILQKPPQSIHQWRQCDCLSITLNYDQDNNPFLKPSMHNLGYDGTGKTMSEFPVIYYMVGNLWKIFGHNEFIYRLIVVLIFFSGLFALFRIFEQELGDSVVAIIISLILFTSPTLVYYGNNFLMDIPAFSLALIGLMYFFKYFKTQQNRYLYYFMFFYLLAGLLKITSLLSFLAILGLFGLELFGMKMDKDRRIFPRPSLKYFLLFAGVLLVLFCWYYYANWYNSKHNKGIFLIGILPIWDLTRDQINVVLDHLNAHIQWDYFRRDMQILFVLMFVSLLVFNKLVKKVWLFLALIMFAGFVMFFILFFQPLRDHDYYTINMFILIPVVMLAFFSTVRNRFTLFFHSGIFKLVLVALLIYNVEFASQQIANRYSPKGWEDKNYFEYLQSFEDIQPYLDSMGIKKNDRVLSLSDNSINITLYVMNQKGWTNFGISGDSAKIQDKIRMGAKYLFIYSEKTLENPGIQPFTKHEIGKFKNIRIYAL